MILLTYKFSNEIGLGGEPSQIYVNVIFPNKLG